MFAGVLGEKNSLRTHLMPIRRQLSILACIFAVGHIAFYAASYVPRLTSAFTGNLAFSLGLAALITALMAVLWVTSAQRVKHAMKAASWKRVQRLAYPFYVLTYVHLALLLMPSALAGNDVAVLSIAVYSIVMGAYVVLRLRKAARRPPHRGHRRHPRPRPGGRCSLASNHQSEITTVSKTASFSPKYASRRKLRLLTRKRLEQWPL